MNFMYKCSFCTIPYSWYGGLYENAQYDPVVACRARREDEDYEEISGGYAAVNGFVLRRIHPINGIENEETVVAEKPKDGLGVCINICPKCMRKILNNLSFNEGTAWDI